MSQPGSDAVAAAGVGADIYGSEKAAIRNMRESKRSRAFALYLMSTAHQRAVKDLQAAGLNPVLTATGPKAFGSAVANQASVQSSTRGMAGTGAKLAKLAPERELLRAQRKMVEQGESTSISQEELNYQQAFRAKEETRLKALQADLLEIPATPGQIFGSWKQEPEKAKKYMGNAWEWLKGTMNYYKDQWLGNEQRSKAEKDKEDN